MHKLRCHPATTKYCPLHMCHCCPEDPPQGGPALLTAGQAADRGILSDENGTRVVSVLFLFDNVIYNTAGLHYQSILSVPLHLFRSFLTKPLPCLNILNTNNLLHLCLLMKTSPNIYRKSRVLLA